MTHASPPMANANSGVLGVNLCLHLPQLSTRGVFVVIISQQHYNSAFGFIWKTAREQCAKGLCKYNFRVRGVLLRAVDCIIKESAALPRTHHSLCKNYIHNEKRAPVNSEALPRSPFWPHANAFLFSPKCFLCCMWQLLKINYMGVLLF